jgi:hypothetical protein
MAFNPFGTTTISPVSLAELNHIFAGAEETGRVGVVCEGDVTALHRLPGGESNSETASIQLKASSS